jgi:UDP-N-acetylenolpyruvoylglucosamine reductase
MHLVQSGVQEVFGIKLQPEPIFVGFEKDTL